MSDKQYFLARYGDPKDIDKNLNDFDSNIRNEAIQHPNATKEHIDKALNDIDWRIRYHAISNPLATKEHIDRALNDEDKLVRSFALDTQEMNKKD